MPKNAQSTPFAKLKMILQKLDNFHEPFGHNKSGGLWLSGTVYKYSILLSFIWNFIRRLDKHLKSLRGTPRIIVGCLKSLQGTLQISVENVRIIVSRTIKSLSGTLIRKIQGPLSTLNCCLFLLTVNFK